MKEQTFFCVRVRIVDDYVHAVCVGEQTLHSVLNGWKELSRLCSRRNIRKVLCQPDPYSPPPFLDVYQFGLSFRAIHWPGGMRIAVVCAPDDLERFRVAEAMVANLSGPVSSIFGSLDEAKAWLDGEE